jgi:type IX secretion system PorP/SprF family membrane protein
MKNNIKYIYSFLLASVSLAVQAQQDPGYTQYMYNTLTVNSAYAGSTGALEATLLHRSQWMGIDGAPKTQAFTIHTPLANESVGLGFSAINDKIGPSDELYLEGNFSYTIPVSYDKKLSFGIKAGARMLNVDWTKGRYYDPVDALLNNNINNQFKPSLGAGVLLHTDKWYVGASVPTFIKSNYYDDVQEAIDYNQLHYYFMGGYVFDFSDNLKFKPAFLVKAVSGAPLTADISANFLLQEKVTLGASYRLDDSVSVLAGFQLSNSFFVGYSYDYTVTDLNKYNDGSHEIILRFQLQKKVKQIKSPRFF